VAAVSEVECEITEVDLDSEDGERQIPGIMATCECGHTTESYGTSESSVLRCLALMREECPDGGNNFYYVSERRRRH
jgi:hypothetical protein